MIIHQVKNINKEGIQLYILVASFGANFQFIYTLIIQGTGKVQENVSQPLFLSKRVSYFLIFLVPPVYFGLRGGEQKSLKDLFRKKSGF